MLGRLEAIVDASGVAPTIERFLPTGGRPRQLPVRTLLAGMLLAQADGRPAHLTRIHRALGALPESDRWRLGVLASWRSGPHPLTYRQTERTFGLVVAALTKDAPDGTPSEALGEVMDALMEASVPEGNKDQTRALAVDWSDLETFSCPPSSSGLPCADPEASWGRRASDAPGTRDELFFGYELQAATMVTEDHGPAVPELTRRIQLTTCSVDPPTAFVGVLERMVASGVPLGDVLADSGYAHRAPEHWALPLRRLGASHVFDLHPHDRGPRGTFAGAIVSNGNCYCPATPTPLLGIGPLAREASKEVTADHDRTTAELSRYKLGRIGADDAEGYHRVMCPAVMGKLRCPLRATSMALALDRPEVLSAPQTPPRCCRAKTITVPPEVAAKTAQKHDYPSAAHRRSYGRRTAAERAFSTAKDPATNDLRRGWCRVMGLASISLFVACLFVVRNERVLRSFEARRADDARRLAAGLPVRTRRRRRRTTADLLTPAPADAPP